MKNHRLAVLGACCIWAALVPAAISAQAPRGDRAAGAAAAGERGAGARGAQQEEAVESRLIPQNDVEILTFESVEDYNKLQELHKESRKGRPKPGTFTTQYYRSQTDRSVQPYGLWVPRQYSDETPCALLIQLHGVSRTDGVKGKRLIFQGMVQADWVDEYSPVIIAHPLGRTNNSYAVMGEADVLDVMADVMDRFKVDPERVFLMGHSMGGGGTKMIGLHYPDHFGSLTPIDAAGGRGTSETGGGGRGGADAAPAVTPDWMKPQQDTFDISKLYGNAGNLNVYIKDAGAGIGGGADNSELDTLIAAGAFATREIFPGMPHHFAPQRSYSMFVPEAIQQPIPKGPAKVDYYTNNLRYNSAYWITLDQLVKHNADATVHAVYDDGQPQGRRGGGAARGAAAADAPAAAPAAEPAATQPSIKIDTDNIAAMTLELAGTVVPEDAEMPVVIDGQTVMEGKLPSVASVAMVDGKWKAVDEPALAGKRHGLQGPLWDAFTVPFLGVYGDGPGAKELAIAELDAVRAQGTYHGDFQIKAASALTQEDIDRFSLILFGGPEANSVVARLADKLPQALMEGPHDGANGVVALLPNPENPARYAVIWTAKLMSAEDSPLPEGVSGRRLLVSLPDYIVLRDGKISDAGHFDNNWKMTK